MANDQQKVQPSTLAMRSGDLINSSTAITGLVGALLSPWIEGALKLVSDHSHGYLVFGDDYATQLTAAMVVLAMYVQGLLHMRSIRKTDAEPTPEP